MFTGPWDIKFHNKFYSKLIAYQDRKLKYILAFIRLLSNGVFIGKGNLSREEGDYGYAVAVGRRMKLPLGHKFFLVKIFRGGNLIVHIGVQKQYVRSMGYMDNTYTSYMQFVDIVPDSVAENVEKLEKLL